MRILAPIFRYFVPLIPRTAFSLSLLFSLCRSHSCPVTFRRFQAASPRNAQSVPAWQSSCTRWKDIHVAEDRWIHAPREKLGLNELRNAVKCLRATFEPTALRFAPVIGLFALSIFHEPEALDKDESNCSARVFGAVLSYHGDNFKLVQESKLWIFIFLWRQLEEDNLKLFSF